MFAKHSGNCGHIALSNDNVQMACKPIHSLTFNEIGDKILNEAQRGIETACAGAAFFTGLKLVYLFFCAKEFITNR